MASVHESLEAHNAQFGSPVPRVHRGEVVLSGLPSRSQKWLKNEKKQLSEPPPIAAFLYYRKTYVVAALGLEIIRIRAYFEGTEIV